MTSFVTKTGLLAITLLVCVVLRCIVMHFYRDRTGHPDGYRRTDLWPLLLLLNKEGASIGHDVCHGGTHVDDQYHSDDSLSFCDQLSDVFSCRSFVA